MEPTFLAQIAPFDMPLETIPETPPTPPPLQRQNAFIEEPPLRERPTPDMKPLVALPSEWLRSLESEPTALEDAATQTNETPPAAPCAACDDSSIAHIGLPLLVGALTGVVIYMTLTKCKHVPTE